VTCEIFDRSQFTNGNEIKRLLCIIHAILKIIFYYTLFIFLFWS